MPSADTYGESGSLAEGKYALAEISGGGKVPFEVSSLELKTL